MATKKTDAAKGKPPQEKKIRVADIVMRTQPVKIRKPETMDDLETKVKREIELAKQSIAPQAEPEATPAPQQVPEEPQPQPKSVFYPIPAVKPGAPIEKQVDDFEKKQIQKFDVEEKKIKKEQRKKISAKTYAVLIIILVLLGSAGYAAAVYLPRADIQITTKKSQWIFADAIVATKKTASIDTSSKSIPAEIFSQRKNFTYSYPATGKKYLSLKATGVITIYNNYSIGPQLLVKNTRFTDPSGRIFRLTQNTIVPGAKIIQGKFTPSSIDANVVADQPGADYNITPSKFKIPGLADTPKYNGFYGISQVPMSGGIIGLAAYPTQNDIKQYEPQVIKSLKDNIDSLLYSGISPAFRVIDGSEQFTILKEVISPVADQSGNFTIFLDAQSSVVAFKDSDVLALMTGLANNILNLQNSSEAFNIKDYKLDYGTGRPDLNQGQMSFVANFSGTFWQPVNTGDFEQKSLGKSETQLKPLIDSLANIDKVTISFWPFWVKSVPSDPSRVKIGVE